MSKPDASSSSSRIATEITHTINVEGKTTSSVFGQSSRPVITKYVIKVRLGVQGAERARLEWQVARRYSHFRSNHLAMAAMFPALRLPKLPPRELMASSNPSLVAERMVGLDAYLKQMVALPGVGSCTQMLTFLGAYHGMQPSWFAQPSWRGSVDDDDEGEEEGAEGGGGGAAAPPLGVGRGGGAAEPAPVDEQASSSHDRQARALLEAVDAPSSIEGFAASFASLGFSDNPEKAAAMAQRFLNGLEAALSVDCNFACSEEALGRAREALEETLMLRLHPKVFGVLEAEREEDARLHARLAALGAVVQPAQLDVPERFADTRFNRWDAARAELRQLDGKATPRAKMDCVLRCVLQLKHGLLESLAATGKGGSFGADELFPTFVYTVLQTNPPRLHSNITYVMRWRNPLALKSEAGCYFTHLQAAVSFLDSLDAGGGSGRAEARESPGAPADAAATEAAATPSTGGSDRAGSPPVAVTREAMEQMRATEVDAAASGWQQKVEAHLSYADGGEPSGADGLDRRASESLPPSPADPLGAAVAVESLRLGASPSGRARSPLGGRDRGRSRSSSGGGQTAEETARALFPDSPPHERGPKP